MMKNRIWTIALLAAALTVTLAASNLVLGKGKPTPPPPPEPDLPAVRYRISFPLLPADSTGGVYINDMNNSGAVVGWYSTTLGRNAFIYSAMNFNEAIDLNTLVAAADMPEDAWLRSGVAINEQGIVVGSLEYVTGEVVGFALDLGAETPVVDLLPDVGSTFSYGTQINENGDILVQVTESDGTQSAYLFSPGLYSADAIANAENRALLGGGAQDFSADTPIPLPMSVGEVFLNNRAGDGSVQIAGATDGVIFRYTTGETPILETFPELNAGRVRGLNDSGTFCGRVELPKKKGRSSSDPFRYNQTLETLSLSEAYSPSDINSSGDLILDYDYIYRDDWGFVNISDIVTGSVSELAVWDSASWLFLDAMNDRSGAVDASDLVGTLAGVEANNILVVLTPEPAPE